MEAIKADVEHMCKLFPILLENWNDLFFLPDELIMTLESSLEKHLSEETFHECVSVMILQHYKHF